MVCFLWEHAMNFDVWHSNMNSAHFIFTTVPLKIIFMVKWLIKSRTSHFELLLKYLGTVKYEIALG